MGSSARRTRTRSFRPGQIGPAATATLLALLIVLAPLGSRDASADHGPPLIWGAAKPMPTARSGLGLAALGGKLYAVGGHAGSTYYNTLEIYDPATDSWSTGPSMPTARAYAGVAVADGKLYVAGGEDTSGALKALEVYDPATNAWSSAFPG